MTYRADPEAAPRHLSVMPAEVLAALAPRDGGIYVDGTFGAGGHARLLLESGPATTVFAIDRDPRAIADGRALQSAYGDRLVLIEGRFADMIDLLAAAGIAAVDGIVLDVGASSMQLDQGERGFSFMRDGPLDMRMGADGISAADVVNTLDEAELKRLLRVLGEERRAHAVVRAIAAARTMAPITRTAALAEIVEKAVGRRPGERISPATRTFQALRIYVNGELGELAAGLGAAERLLHPGGRLAVLTFHSLEDRIVKRFLKERTGAMARPSRHVPPVERRPATFIDLLPGGATASDKEIAANPRARSARLRAAERTAAPAQPLDLADFGEVVQLAAGGGC
jgi:16S rRNA (cytosine1402-N4)-methyltransferase